MGMMPTRDTKPKIVFRLSHLGDVALTTGVLTHWHETHGDSFIFITRRAHAPILDGHPALSRVIGLEDREVKEWLNTARALAREFAEHELIDLHGTLRSRILSLLWRGPVRRYPKLGLTRRLYDRTHADRLRVRLEATTVPQRYAMALDAQPPAAATLGPRLHPTCAERAEADMRLTDFDEYQPIIALHPYATHPAKQWPREHWLGLTGLLAGANMNWFVVGRDPAPLLPGHERDFTNKTDLRETCALMELADVLVSADSGPMHLASGVGTPVAALFGPTTRAWGFYPSGPDDRILELPLGCRPCSLHGGGTCTKGHQCLNAIAPETVMTTLGEMLAQTRHGAPADPDLHD
jgi:ADP-heptose:LPS heptosyltransferase